MKSFATIQLAAIHEEKIKISSMLAPTASEFSNFSKCFPYFAMQMHVFG